MVQSKLGGALCPLFLCFIVSPPCFCSSFLVSYASGIDLCVFWFYDDDVVFLLISLPGYWFLLLVSLIAVR